MVRSKLSTGFYALVLPVFVAACAGNYKLTEVPASNDQNLQTSQSVPSPTPTPTSAPKAVCSFNGQTYNDGDQVTAYLASSVPYGDSCQSETRVCHDGAFDGSFRYATCDVGAPAACEFNGQTIPSGDSVTAYVNSTVPYGQTCQSETRSCNNGVLSGQNTFASCTVDGPASCLWDGKTIPSGSTVTAFQNPTVPYGSTCVSEARLCTNGVLSGQYDYATCNPDAPKPCLFNGQTIPNGGTVTGFLTSTVPYGQICQSQTRTCNNGVLDGQYSFGSCAVDKPASCVWNGTTYPDGGTITAYLASTVPYGQTCQSQTRTCGNGSWSGSYSNVTCNVDAPKSCSFNGQNVANGASITTYLTSTVPYGQTCQSETRTCADGVLSGSYMSATCVPDAPAACTFGDKTIASGSSITEFQASTVAYGQTCNSEVRTCTNGVLSGSFAFDSCNVDAPQSCLLNGQTIASGASVTEFQSSSVPFGSTCVSEQRTCNNGVLSGSYSSPTCTPDAPASCSINGQTVPSGGTVTLFKAPSVPAGQTCQSEVRTCTNGTLSGSATYGSCTVDAQTGGGNTDCHDFTQVTQPLKIIVMLDQSGSTTTTDPNKSFRLTILNNFINQFSTNTAFKWNLDYFNGTTATALIKDSKGNPSFGDATAMKNAVTAYSKLSPTGNTPYTSAISMIKAAIQNDPDFKSSTPQNYVVIMMSDGQPTDVPSGKDPVAYEGTAVTGVTALSATHITFSTIFFDFSNDSATTRQTAINVLQNMAITGGGQFANTVVEGSNIFLNNVATVPSAICTPSN